MQHQARIMFLLMLLLSLCCMLEGCRHTHSNLHEAGEAGPHEIDKPDQDKWQDRSIREDRDGGRSNSDVAPDPKDDKQDVSGKAPESRPSTGEKKGGGVIINEVDGEIRPHINSFILRGPAPKGGGGNIGALSSDERETYRYTHFGKGIGAGDRGSIGHGGSKSPSRSGNYGSYKKHYKNFAELKKDVESREDEYKKVMSDAVNTFTHDRQRANAMAQVTSYVNKHNKFVAGVTQKQPLIASLTVPSETDQKTPLQTAEGRQVRIAKNYSRYVRASIESGHEKGHENSGKLLDFADASIELGDQFYLDGDNSEGDSAIAVALAAVDLALDFTPGVGLAKDIVSLVTGVNPVTGHRLSSSEKAITTASLFIPSAFSGIRKVIQRADELAKRAVNIISKRSGTVSKHQETLTSSFQGLSKILSGPKTIRPTLGNKYVRDLPDLSKSYKDAFEGPILKGVYEPGEILFQVQRRGQKAPGHWFGPIKPLDPDHADELFNIRKWGNDASITKTFVVKERVSGYAGKVAGGEGHQFFIPTEFDLREIVEEIL